MKNQFELPIISRNCVGRLCISGEYVLKTEKCECGNPWSHVVFWPDKIWLQVCSDCAEIAKHVYRDVVVLSGDEVQDMACAPRLRNYKHVRPNYRSVFWEETVTDWIAQQQRPVTYREIAQQFDRKKENVLHFLRKLMNEGKLECVAFDKRSRGYLAKGESYEHEQRSQY